MGGAAQEWETGSSADEEPEDASERGDETAEEFEEQFLVRAGSREGEILAEWRDDEDEEAVG